MRHPSLILTAALAFPVIALAQSTGAKAAPASPTAAQEKKVRAVLDASRADFDPCLAAAKEYAATRPEMDRLRAEVQKHTAEPAKSSEEAKKNFETAQQFAALSSKQTAVYLRMVECENKFLAAAKPKLKATGVSEKGIAEIFGKWKAEQSKPE
jgi:hypothetical protein